MDGASQPQKQTEEEMVRVSAGSTTTAEPQSQGQGPHTTDDRKQAQSKAGGGVRGGKTGGRPGEWLAFLADWLAGNCV